MKWTKELPKVKGRYWLRSCSLGLKEVIFAGPWVARDLKVHFLGNAEFTKLEQLPDDLEWSDGPIPEPSDP